MFSTHFADNRPHQTTTISLLGIRQEPNEPLRVFIDRFRKAALRTPHLNQEMILQCMTLTLQPGPFANNVYLHPPASMHELKLRAADYVCMEEMQTLHTKFCNDYAATTANPIPPPTRTPPTSLHQIRPPYRSPFLHPRRSPPSRSNPSTTQDNHTPQRGHDQILSLPPQPWPHYRRMQSTLG